MAHFEELSNEEIRKMIIRSLKETGIDIELVQVKVKEGPSVVLTGEVGSEKDRDVVLDTIEDVIGIDDIDDQLSIIGSSDEAVSGDDSDDEEDEEDELLDEDNEYMGTKDVFKSVEDGLPYIPPTKASFDEEEDAKKKRRPPRRGK